MLFEFPEIPPEEIGINSTLSSAAVPQSVEITSSNFSVRVYIVSNCVLSRCDFCRVLSPTDPLPTGDSGGGSRENVQTSTVARFIHRTAQTEEQRLKTNAKKTTQKPTGSRACHVGAVCTRVETRDLRVYAIFIVILLTCESKGG